MYAFLVSEEFYFGYITFLLGLFIFFAYWVYSRYLSASRDAVLLEKQLEQLKSVPDPDDRVSRLQAWLAAQDTVYFNEAVKPAWELFYVKVQSFRRSGSRFIPDIYSFFHEETFIQTYGRRKFVELIPGLFLAFGIVGTFLGIAVGVSGLDPSGDTAVMKDGIGLLLSGMKVKFWSSIAGILLSVLWQLLDKSWLYGKLLESFYLLRQQLDDCFPTQEDGDVFARMLEVQEKQMLDFQSYLSEQLIPQMMAGFTGVMNHTVVGQMEKTQAVQETQLANLHAFMTEQLLPGTTGRLSAMEQAVTEGLKRLGSSQSETLTSQLEKLRTSQEQQSQEMQTYLTGTLLPSALSGMTSVIDQTLLPQLERAKASQEAQFAGLQTYMAEQMVPDMMNGFSEAVNQALVPPLQETQRLIYDLIEKASVNQVEGMRQLTSEIMKSLNELTAEQMERLGASLQATVEWQRQVYGELASLVQALQTSAERQTTMAETTGALTERMEKYADRMTDYQDRLNGTVDVLNGTAERHAEVQNVVAGLLERMVEEREVFHTHFELHLDELRSNVEAIHGETDKQAAVQTQLERNLTQLNGLTESQRELAAALSGQAEYGRQTAEGIQQWLERFHSSADALADLQGSIAEMLERTAVENKRLNEMKQSLEDNLVKQVGLIDQRTQALTVLWKTTGDVMTKAGDTLNQMNKQLAVSMNQFSDDMHRGLTFTFKQFDEELSKSVHLLANGVNAMRDGLSDLPEAIQELRQTVGDMTDAVAVRKPVEA